MHFSPPPHGDRPCGSGGPKLGEEPAVLRTQAPTTLGPAAEAQRWDLRQRRWSVGGTRSQVHSGDSGGRNPKPALRRCHLLESRGFYGVESLNPAERGPRTGVARGGSVRKHRDVVPQTKVTVSSKGPKVVEASEELPGRRLDAL